MSDAVGWPTPLQGAGLRQSWDIHWAGLDADPAVGLYETLLQAWSEPHRRYHDVKHLGECLALLKRWKNAAMRPAEVGLALWFHDAVYDVRAHDNECRSAEWAVSVLRQAGVQDEAVQRVRQLIMATQHAGGSVDSMDECLLLDIDLAILGSPPARFAEYDLAVGQEYAWVPESVYRPKRLEILQQLRARELYRTPQAKGLLEQQALMNLSEAIQKLT